MKAREERLKVAVAIRLHTGSAWVNATILNMSSRGLMLNAEAELKRGDYVEMRRGTLIIIARVVWVRGTHMGLRAQDQIDISAIVNEPRLLTRPQSAALQQPGERRREISRTASENIIRRAERSRDLARLAQFVVIGGAGAAAGIVLVGTVGQFLAGVSSTIQAALGGG